MRMKVEIDMYILTKCLLDIFLSTYSHRVWGPFIVEAYTNPIGKSVYVRGLFYDIWQILEAKLNFSTILTKMKDGKSKGWSFIMQTVVEKEHDLFLAGNSLTESRQSLSCNTCVMCNNMCTSFSWDI